MARAAERPSSPRGYFVGFGLTAILLTGLTLVLVLVVLPRRYVLRAGLRESGLSFPSEAAPFLPPPERYREAPVLPPVRPEGEPEGPAQQFWDQVLPLLEAGSFSESIPLFQAYLNQFPDDRGVLREYGITLSRSGQSDDAVGVFQAILLNESDPALRLLLARSLRDLGRLDEASEQYSLLLEHDAANTDLAREWAMARAWAREYEEAARILESALQTEPGSAEIRTDLARVYYWGGRLSDADEILSMVDRDTLVLLGADSLRESIVTALTPPDTPAGSIEPSLIEKAEEALVDGRFEASADLYRQALRASPQDSAGWRGYADLLQFRLDDLEGAREALLRVEALGSPGAALRFRIAQLDAWTGRTEDGLSRLLGLLEERETKSIPPVSGVDSSFWTDAQEAEVHALIGDVLRWEGERMKSAEAYRSAMAADSLNRQALMGMEELEGEVTREMNREEDPRLGATGFAFGDSDDFDRVDLAAEWVGVEGRWAWAMQAGSRWLGGLHLAGESGNERGQFFTGSVGRWWRMGTVRSAGRLGVEDLDGGGVDLSLEGSLRFGSLGGFQTDVSFQHGPAYPVAVTLQSVSADLFQERLVTTLSRQVAPRWSLALGGEAAWLHADGMEKGAQRGSLRTEGAVTLGRLVTETLTMGVSARALAYSKASPAVDGLRLFWDPRKLVAGGAFARWDWDFGDRWEIGAQVSPSYAFIDERTRVGFDGVPHLSGEVGLTFNSDRFRTTLDGSYYQGRLEGYRAFGIRLSVAARDWLTGRSR